MKDEHLYLFHIAVRCERIMEFIANGRDFFFNSECLQF